MIDFTKDTLIVCKSRKIYMNMRSSFSFVTSVTFYINTKKMFQIIIIHTKKIKLGLFLPITKGQCAVIILEHYSSLVGGPVV
jgi:hypothetical protein